MNKLLDQFEQGTLLDDIANLSHFELPDVPTLRFHRSVCLDILGRMVKEDSEEIRQVFKQQIEKHLEKVEILLLHFEYQHSY